MEKVCISVVMPVYNAEKYLKTSIESILNQTFSNFEFIIINDGSTDRSLEIIQRYAKKDDRIKVISRENKGIVRSLNEGIKAAKGKYIARMDADDIAYSERFEKQVSFLEDNLEYGIVASFVEIFGDAYDLEYNKFVERNHNKEDFEFIDLLCGGFSICHPTVIIKKELFNKYGYYCEKYKYCEDLELWIRFMLNGVKIKNLPIVLLKYRKDIGSKTYQDQDIYINDIVNMRLEAINKINNIGNKPINYYIWGAGNGGKLCYEKCKSVFKNGNLLGYIDLYQKGEIDKKNIYMPNILQQTEFDYVFIASAPGVFYALIYMSKIGKKIVKDFINVF